ncbi:MAG: hypothetical protein WC707_05500 [Candidatus Babeliaceae bacterium]|jgi:chaperonin cofactor prefoldin
MNYKLKAFYVAFVTVVYVGVVHTAHKQKVPHVTLHERLEKIDSRVSALEEKYQKLSKKVSDMQDILESSED